MSRPEEEFLQSLRNGEVKQAYLIAGSADAPLDETVEEAAAILLCMAEDGEKKPCGVCKGCLQRKENTNADLIILDVLPGKKEISINSVRDMEKALKKVSAVGGRRVVLCKGVQRMKDKAQNALLKTLEEPPENATFLLSGTENSLLPTVRSRCNIIRLAAEDKEETDKEKKARLAAEADMAAILAGKQADLIKDFGKTRDDMDRALETMAEYCRDALACGLKVEPLRNREGLDKAAAVGEKRLLQSVAILTEARERLTRNAGVKVVADWVLSSLYRLFD